MHSVFNSLLCLSCRQTGSRSLPPSFQQSGAERGCRVVCVEEKGWLLARMTQQFTRQQETVNTKEAVVFRTTWPPAKSS